MIWSREALTNLAEDELCREVLVPLFEAMGYQGVYYHHGGPGELGKDIVMWKSDPAIGRRDYAVVAKAVDIKGGAGSSVMQTVAMQVRQCFGSAYKDSKTGEPRVVHHCFVITSGKFPKESKDALRAALRDVSHHVTFFDGTELWTLIEAHLAERLVLSRLRSSAEILDSASPDWGVMVSLMGRNMAFQLVPKTPEAQPVPVSLRPRFPDTPEGQKAKDEYEKHEERGSPVTLDSTMIEEFIVPDFLRALLPTGPNYQLTLGLSPQLPEPLIARAEITSPSDRFTIHYIELSVVRGGSKEISLSNELQKTPFHFHLIFPHEGEGRLKFTFSARGHNIHRLWETERFLHCAQKGADITLYDLETGNPLLAARFNGDEVGELNEDFLNLLEKVLYIQRATRVLFDAPNDGFSIEDAEDISTAYNALMTGTVSVTSVNISTAPGAASKFLAIPEGVRTVFSRPDFTLRVLGKDVPLGPIEVRCDQTKIDPADRKLLETAGDQGISFRIVPVEGSTMEARLLNWPAEVPTTR